MSVTINRGIISKNSFWSIKTQQGINSKREERFGELWIVKYSIQFVSSFIALNERSMASFENFSLLPPIVSPGYFVGICKEEEEARGGACPCRPPLPPRYSSRVRCKRDSGQGRGREKFSAGSWNVVRTDVTRTANYLRMFQLGRVGRFVPICIIIARNIFKTGIKSLFGIEEKQSRWKFFRINAKFRVKLNWKIPFFFCYFFILKKRTNIFF